VKRRNPMRRKRKRQERAYYREREQRKREYRPTAIEFVDEQFGMYAEAVIGGRCPRCEQLIQMQPLGEDELPDVGLVDHFEWTMTHAVDCPFPTLLTEAPEMARIFDIRWGFVPVSARRADGKAIALVRPIREPSPGDPPVPDVAVR
jgi:hypothetical protein